MFRKCLLLSALVSSIAVACLAQIGCDAEPPPTKDTTSVYCSVMSDAVWCSSLAN